MTDRHYKWRLLSNMVDHSYEEEPIYKQYLFLSMLVIRVLGGPLSIPKSIKSWKVCTNFKESKEIIRQVCVRNLFLEDVRLWKVGKGFDSIRTDKKHDKANLI